jgi:hypothetical protein
MLLFIGFFVFQHVRPLQYIDPFDRMPTHYEDYAAEREDVPFTFQIVFDQNAQRDDLIVIIVNDSLYPRIQGAIDQYVLDLQAEGFSTQLITTLGGTAQDIRNLLIAQMSNGLVGGVMIGDLPIAWWEESSYGEDYPIDLFFSDLNGSWTDGNNNGKYDGHSGSAAPDIWVGRLHASCLTYDNEARLINNYFDVNHQYRTGVLTLPNRGLVYNEVTWSPNDHGMSYLYNDVTVENNENTTTAYDYKNRLGQEFQFVHLVAHSSCWAHTFFLQNELPGGGSVFNFEIPFVDPKAFFFFLNCCMAARFTETDNLANWYLFSHTYSQVVVASSSLMYGINGMADFYGALGNDSTFGDAFKKWHQDNYDWFMGTLVLGDPSLKVLDHRLRHVQHDDVVYSDQPRVDWTTYQVENSQFVNGHPCMGTSEGGLWIFWDSGRIVRSDTYGSSFTGSGFAPAESIAWHEYYDFFPAATTDHSGRLWVAWQSFRDYSQYYDHFNIYSTYRYGSSWSAPQHVQPMGGWHDVQPTLAAGSDDKVWVVFKSFRTGNADVYVSNATSGGTWINSYALTQTPEDETDPTIVVDQDNHVWVFWTGSSSGHYHIYGRQFTTVWHDIFVIDTSLSDNCALKAGVDSLNQIWLVWHRWVNDQAEVYCSHYNGSTWESPSPITNDASDDILPSITIDELGRPWVCWMSNRNGNWDIYYSYYNIDWTLPEAITTDPGIDIDPEIIADDQSRIWIGWASNRDNYWNIFAASANITGVQEQTPIAYQGPVVFTIPNPFSTAIRFESQKPCEIAIYNSAGRLVTEFKGSTTSHQWKPQGISPGAYFARVTTDQGQEYVKIIYVK